MKKLRADILPRSHPYNPNYLKFALQKWADTVFSRFGLPVYLVGSALKDPNQVWVRDIDVRVIMPDDHFAARFGDPKSDEGKWRWAEEMGKQNFWAARQTLMPVDFQVMPDEKAKYYRDDPKLRLDSGRDI